jgi:hypothetical protein
VIIELGVHDGDTLQLGWMRGILRAGFLVVFVVGFAVINLSVFVLGQYIRIVGAVSATVSEW